MNEQTERMLELLRELLEEAKQTKELLELSLSRKGGSGRYSELGLEVQKMRIEERRAKRELEAQVEARRRGLIPASEIKESREKAQAMTADRLVEMLEDE